MERDRRLLLLSGFLSVIGVLLIVRLMYIQIIKGPSLAEKALSQRKSNFSSEIRGEIVDRNGKSLSGSYSTTYAVISSQWLAAEDKDALIKRGILKSLDDKVTNTLVHPKNIEILRKISQKTPGIYLYEKTIPYGKEALATHVIGYYGKAGLEKTLDHFLSGDNKANIILNDGLGQPIIGLSQEATEFIPFVRISIDKEIQQIVEKIMDERVNRGAVVVLEANTSEVLAMASRPNYKQYNLRDYLKADGAPLINRAVEAYIPGSIFKIVVLSAALEEGISHLDDRFICNGFEKVGGNVFNCYSYKNGGHGEITLKDAMAYSCNSVFIQLGLKLGNEKIIKYAKAFGLGEVTNIGLPEEKGGNIPEPKDVFYQDIGNIAMGQGAISITPLQVAQMLSVIVNKGKLKKPFLIKEVIDGEGKMQSFIKESNCRQIISSETSEKVKECLLAATQYGTGSPSVTSMGEDSAGKTGTAEIGEGIYHAWFAGFYPAKEPLYIICVFIEEGGSGSHKAAPIFREIVEKLSHVTSNF